MTDATAQSSALFRGWKALILGTAFAALALTAMPAPAQADPPRGYYNDHNGPHHRHWKRHPRVVRRGPPPRIYYAPPPPHVVYAPPPVVYAPPAPPAGINLIIPLDFR